MSSFYTCPPLPRVPVQGTRVTADTIIDSVPHVPSLDQCRQLCLDMDSCPYISYSYDNAVPVPSFCQLFTSCESVNNCSDCYTENIDCRTCGENIIRGLNENVKTWFPTSFYLILWCGYWNKSLFFLRIWSLYTFIFILVPAPNSSLVYLVDAF